MKKPQSAKSLYETIDSMAHRERICFKIKDATATRHTIEVYTTDTAWSVKKNVLITICDICGKFDKNQGHQKKSIQWKYFQMSTAEMIFNLIADEKGALNAETNLLSMR